MENINISKKVVGILLLIFFLFLILIIKAFDYLPEADYKNIEEPTAKIEKVKTEQKEVLEAETLDNEDEQEDTRQLSGNLYRSTQRDEFDEQFELLNPVEKKEEVVNNFEAISEPAPSLTTREKIELQLLSIQALKKEKQYAKAIEEYKQVISNTNDVEVHARCYEQMAEINAITKHYGSALTYAQKAYSLSPTTNREMLIARIYYKTGDIDKATSKVNNILQRDFSYDR